MITSRTRNSIKTRALSALLFLGFSMSFVSHAEDIPRELRDIGIDEHLGSTVDLSLPFTNEAGEKVPLRTYFNGTKPVLFFLVYYECPNLCTFVLNGAIDALKGQNLTVGKDFDVVAVSIDPKETPTLAVQKKSAYLKSYGKPETANHWHFLVGEQGPITTLSNQIGFKFKWDDQIKQFAHASAMFVLTGEGKISRYFYGVLYPSTDVKFALLEASRGHIGSIVDKILLFCYHYDASTKKYVLLASRIMSAGGAAMLLILTSFLIVAWRREKRLSLSSVRRGI